MINNEVVRQCKKCFQDFPATKEFFRQYRNKYYDRVCRGCRNLENIEHQNKLKQQHYENGVDRSGKKQCVICHKVKIKTEFNICSKNKTVLYTYCKKCSVIKSRKKKFGLSDDDFRKIMLLQEHRCAICRYEFKTESEISIDHNHITGKVRGILCKSCNAILGYAYEKIDTLKKSIIYLEKFKNDVIG